MKPNFNNNNEDDDDDEDAPPPLPRKKSLPRSIRQTEPIYVNLPFYQNGLLTS